MAIELIVPPELARTVKKMSSANIAGAVGAAVKDSRPAARKPPKFGSLVTTRVSVDSAGFQASTVGVVAMGAEFGSRGIRRRSYATRSRSGNPYIVRRRTTRQFLSSNPRGYALLPAMRDSMGGIHQRIFDELAEAVTP